VKGNRRWLIALLTLREEQRFKIMFYMYNNINRLRVRRATWLAKNLSRLKKSTRFLQG